MLSNGVNYSKETINEAIGVSMYSNSESTVLTYVSILKPYVYNLNYSTERLTFFSVF
jgi:hypothetical protein